MSVRDALMRRVALNAVTRAMMRVDQDAFVALDEKNGRVRVVTGKNVSQVSDKLTALLEKTLPDSQAYRVINMVTVEGKAK